MTGLMLHTLVWTGVLIAAVLVLRRPVSKAFGPEAAYALWALPLLRLVLPPLTLPAWMAPEAKAPAVAMTVAPLPGDAVVWQAVADAPVAAAPAGFDITALLTDLPLLEGLLLAWLGGAAVFLALRFAAYFSLRAALLADAHDVGSMPGAFGGLLRPVRLVETPATNAPLAMGVLNPVIALPSGFLALHDREARDLALAHELAHHRGGDLLVNVLVQPLFALHWFNPLARYGWLALRCDQEAACDARVMARRSARERAAYAALIARFAAAPGAAHTAALSAPMACPVLGEKSIIHRLRSLAMFEMSPRRRLAGRALLGAGLLALPLTASISYAASEALRDVPAPPAAPSPEAPPVPVAPPAAPDAHTPPEAPNPPSVVLIERAGEGDGTVTEHVWRDAEGKERRVKMVFRSAPDAEMLAHRPEGTIVPTPAERAEMIAEMRADLPRIVSEAMAASETARASAPDVMVLKECTSAFAGQAQIIKDKDGKQTVMICQIRVPASARLGLEQARAEIAGDKDIPEDTRKQLLSTLDGQIARWKEKEG
jgi:beta-lactamase regulating signal transducer with metallopeptidase domain